MATDDKALVAVCDAGPLIHLDELNGLGLLSDFAKILVPAAVAAEVIPYRPTIFARTDLNWVRCSPVLPCAQDLAVLCRIFSLHAGEIEALAQMERYPASILLTDDSAAR